MGETNYCDSGVGYVTDAKEAGGKVQYDALVQQQKLGGNIEPLVAPAFMS